MAAIKAMHAQFVDQADGSIEWPLKVSVLMSTRPPERAAKHWQGRHTSRMRSGCLVLIGDQWRKSAMGARTAHRMQVGTAAKSS
jgi:hypothetical protein